MNFERQDNYLASRRLEEQYQDMDIDTEPDFDEDKDQLEERREERRKCASTIG